MTLAGIITLITGLFQFPGQLIQLIKVLQATPEEKQQAIMDAVNTEALKYQAPGGRPTWD